VRKLLIPLALLIATACGRAQNLPIVPVTASPASCPNALPLYVILVGYAGAGDLYGNSGTGSSCALLASPGGGVSSVSNSDGTLTITPTTGAVVASLALGHANTWTAAQTFVTPVLGTPASGVITNLTGTCTSCNIGGNAATATTAVGISGTQTANFFYAAPNGSSGVLSPRAIVAADLPNGVSRTTYALTASTPITNTGNTTQNQALSISIPANTITSAGRLEWAYSTGGCTGSGTPYAGCTAANVQGCIFTSFLSTTNTGKTVQIASGGEPVNGFMREFATIQASGSVSAERVASWYTATPTAAGAGTYNAATTFNLGNQLYLNVFIQNNATASDTCYIDSAQLTAYP
jgi:hypothetical protein